MELLCRRCGEPVVTRPEDYDLFEGMHWICFHLEFEHDAEPGHPCSDVSCPWWHLELYREALVHAGIDPAGVINRAIEKKVQRDLKRSREG